MLNDAENITVLQNSENPFEFYVGSSEGLVWVYDLWFGKYVSEKRHPYMLPIKSIETHNKARMIISTDSQSIWIASKDNLDNMLAVYEQ